MFFQFSLIKSCLDVEERDFLKATFAEFRTPDATLENCLVAL